MAAQEVNAQGLGAILLRGGGICDLANKSDALLPGGIGSQHRGVIEGENLAAGLQRLGKSKHITGRKRAGAGVVLEIIFSRDVVFGAEQIVEVEINLVRFESAGWAGLDGVTAYKC